MPVPKRRSCDVGAGHRHRPDRAAGVDAEAVGTAGIDLCGDDGDVHGLRAMPVLLSAVVVTCRW